MRTMYYLGNMPISDELYHHGIKGQKWGVRRFQNPDGTLTSEGIERYKEYYDKKHKAKLRREFKAITQNKSTGHTVARGLTRTIGAGVLGSYIGKALVGGAVYAKANVTTVYTGLLAGMIPGLQPAAAAAIGAAVLATPVAAISIRKIKDYRNGIKRLTESGVTLEELKRSR